MYQHDLIKLKENIKQPYKLEKKGKNKKRTPMYYVFEKTYPLDIVESLN